MWWDLAPQPTHTHPFARSEITAGQPLAPELFEFVEVPVGLFSELEIEGVAAVTLNKGEPLLASSVTQFTPPDGWWTVEMELPDGSVPGASVQVALLQTNPSLPTQTVPGFVVAPNGQGSSFSSNVGLIAVPEQFLNQVASSLSQHRVVVFLDR